MTRESILAMPAGPEMDALVAERVMGWTWEPGPYLQDPETPRRAHPQSTRNAPDPYSTNIAAAWLVVEKLNDKKIAEAGGDWSWPVEITYICDEGREGWCVQFQGRHDAVAEPAPLAICRAALLTTLDQP